MIVPSDKALKKRIPPILKMGDNVTTFCLSTKDGSAFLKSEVKILAAVILDCQFISPKKQLRSIRKDIQAQHQFFPSGRSDLFIRLNMFASD